MEDKLIKKLNKGDVKAFEQIISTYSGYVISIVNRRSGGLLSAEDAEEIAADTFAALWKERGKIDPQKPLMPYLAAISGNAAISRLRVLKLNLSIEDVDEPASDDFVTEIESKEAMREILSSLDKLTDKQREIFIRFYFYGESINEISELMKISSSDVRTTLHRTREKVKSILTERGYSYE